MNALTTDLRKGGTLTCKYPKGGYRNILKKHIGVIKALGCSQNGVYATIQEEDGKNRSLSLSKMIDPVVG